MGCSVPSRLSAHTCWDKQGVLAPFIDSASRPQLSARVPVTLIDTLIL